MDAAVTQGYQFGSQVCNRNTRLNKNNAYHFYLSLLFCKFRRTEFNFHTPTTISQDIVQQLKHPLCKYFIMKRFLNYYRSYWLQTVTYQIAKYSCQKVPKSEFKS